MRRARTRFWAGVLLGTFLVVGAGASQVHAADLEKLDSSLKEIPADASYYVSLMRNREQVEAVLHSKAWTKLMALPALQKAWEEAHAQDQKSGGSLEQFQKWLKDPENRDLVDLLLDMVSDEVFLYGGANVSDVGDLYGRTLSAVFVKALRDGFSAAAKGEKVEKNPGFDDPEMTRAMLREVVKNPNALVVPDVVIGFKITNRERATAQIKRLEKLIQQGMEQKPELNKFKDRLKWTKVGNDSFFTINFTSKDLKFDEESIRKFEEKPGQYDAVVKRLKDMQLTLSLGVRGKYLLFVMGETTAPLARLGTGKRLIDQPELKPLARFADQRLTSISYQSKAFRSQTSASYFDMQKWIVAGRESLSSTKLSPEVQARVRKDLDALLAEMKAREPKPGAELSFAFLTTRGKESYEYDWSEHPSDDGSKPLTILSHVGGDPLFLSASRTKSDPQAWPRFVRWFKVYWSYMEDYGLATITPEEKQKYDEFMKTAKPLLARLDEATTKMFVPSLADGQSAFVVDAKFSSKQLHKSLPETPQPVTVPEPALVYGVSDAELLEKAMAEYRSIANDWMAAIAKSSPQPPPITEVPAPKARRIKGGTLYFYPLPEEWGLDKRVLPNAALSGQMAVLTLSQQHSERLLTATPLRTIGKPLANLARPLVGATQFNFAGLVDLMVGWGDSAPALAPPDQRTEEVIKQARTVIEILKVFRGYCSARYLEGGALVTHSEWVFIDLP